MRRLLELTHQRGLCSDPQTPRVETLMAEAVIGASFDAELLRARPLTLVLSDIEPASRLGLAECQGLMRHGVSFPTHALAGHAHRERPRKGLERGLRATPGAWLAQPE
jgi:hypothetical protein